MRLKDIIPYIVILILAYFLFSKEEPKKIKPNVITIIRDSIIKGKDSVIKIEKPIPYKVTVYKDSTLLDSIEHYKALLELFKTREYKQTHKDSSITIDIYAKTIGKLDSLSFRYVLSDLKVPIKETHITNYLKPKYTVYGGVGVNTSGYLDVSIGYGNEKGVLSIGADTNGFYSLRYQRSLFTKW